MFGINEKAIGIDLGTVNTLIYVKGKGIVLREPSVVAIQSDTRQIVAVGNEAKEMIGRTSGQLMAIRPLKEGVISDYDHTSLMIKHFLKMSKQKAFGRVKPNVLLSIPSDVTTVERRAVIDSARLAGAQDAFLIEEIYASAVGSGLPVWEASGSMVVNIGGGTTEAGIISLGGIVTCKCVRVGGDEMDKSITQYIRKKYNLIIGERTAERIKTEIGSAENLDGLASLEIRGRDLVTGLPKSIQMHAEEVRESLSEVINTIVHTVKHTLESTPPELAADIIEKGIMLTGGGALLRNLDKVISRETQIPVMIADHPLDCVAMGTGKALDNIKLFMKKSNK